jgi:hypothetical protein
MLLTSFLASRSLTVVWITLYYYNTYINLLYSTNNFYFSMTNTSTHRSPPTMLPKVLHPQQNIGHFVHPQTTMNEGYAQARRQAFLETALQWEF